MTPKTMGAAPVAGSAGAPRASARPGTSEAMTSEIPLLIARLLSAGRDDRSPSIRNDMCSRPVCFPLPAVPRAWNVARTRPNPGSRGSWGTRAGASRGSRKTLRKGITRSDRSPVCRGALRADSVLWASGVGRGNMRAARRVKRAPAPGHQRRRASHIKDSRQEHVFLLSLDMLCIAGFDGYFKQLNPAWEKTLGFTREELTAKPFGEFVHPDDRAATVAEAGRLMAGAETVTFENRYLTRDGSYKWLLWSTAVSLEDQLYYAVARDVTERKRADEALRLAKHETDRANRAKSEFLSRMSHELRTPLNAILGFAQLMEMDSLRPDQRESVGHILKGGRHLLDLINEVLDIARIEAGRLTVSVEAVSVKEVLQEALDLITPPAASGDVRLTGRAAGILDRLVLAHPQRPQQGLLTLLSNAVKYNRKGGTVALSSKEIAAGRLQIKVSDTGAGIAPERLERLFTPFERLGAEQTGVEGVGLGLALSKGLVEAMGGTLGVESALDRGSAFWVEFPVVDSPVMRLDKTGVPLPAQASPEISRQAQTAPYIEAHH